MKFLKLFSLIFVFYFGLTLNAEIAKPARALVETKDKQIQEVMLSDEFVQWYSELLKEIYVNEFDDFLARMNKSFATSGDSVEVTKNIWSGRAVHKYYLGEIEKLVAEAEMDIKTKLNEDYLVAVKRYTKTAIKGE